MFRLTIVILALIPVTLVATLGLRGTRSERPPLTFWDDMVHQDKYKPQGPSRFFADGRAMRTPPAETVPWGHQAANPDPRFSMPDDKRFAMSENPLPLTLELLQRGQLLYEINCTVCHGGTGSGNGITTHYGMLNPPSLHIDRLLEVTDGEIYRVITLGKNQMGPYGDRIKPDDRWAVVAYVRALQLSQSVSIQELPEDVQSRLEQLR